MLLDHCNALLYGLLDYLIQRLQCYERGSTPFQRLEGTLRSLSFVYSALKLLWTVFLSVLSHAAIIWFT